MTEHDETRRWSRRCFLQHAALAGVGMVGFTVLKIEPLYAALSRQGDETGHWAMVGDRSVGRPCAVLNDDKVELFLRSDAPKNSLWVTQQKEANGAGGFDGWIVYEGAQVLRDPAAVRHDNGDIWVALVNANQELRLAQRKDGAWVQPWAKLPRLDSLGVLGNPVLIPAGHGGLLLAVRYQARGSAAPTTYAYFKYCNDKGVWGGWVSGSFLGTTDMAGYGQDDGTTLVFARDAKGKLACALFKPGSVYPLWKNGLSSEFQGVPAVGKYSDGRLAVFVTGGDPKNPRLFRRTQKSPNEIFTTDEDWEQEGDLAVQGTVMVAAQPDKKVVVVARSSDKKIAVKRQNEPDGDFGEWTEIDGGSLKFNADPMVAANADGRLEIYARAADGNLYYTRQSDPNGDFAKPI